MGIANILKSPQEKLLQPFCLEQYLICAFVAKKLLLLNKPRKEPHFVCPPLIASVMLAVPGTMSDQDYGKVVFMLEALVRR